MKNVHEKIDYNSYPSGKKLFEFLSNRTLDNLEQLPENIKTSSKKIRILSLGCGLAVDFSALSVFFDKLGIEVEYIGVDIDQESIKIAKAIYNKFNNATFYCLDASNPDNLNFIKQKSIDLIVLQHPYLLNDQPKIQNAFINIITDTIPTYLSPSGYMYASFYYQEEIQIFANLTIKGKSVFRGRRDYVITHKDGIIDSQSRQFIPEQYTWITQTPLQFNDKQNTNCCWATLFVTAGAMATAAAINYYTNTP